MLFKINDDDDDDDDSSSSSSSLSIHVLFAMGRHDKEFQQQEQQIAPTLIVHFLSQVHIVKPINGNLE